MSDLTATGMMVNEVKASTRLRAELLSLRMLTLVTEAVQGTRSIEDVLEEATARLEKDLLDFEKEAHRTALRSAAETLSRHHLLPDEETKKVAAEYGCSESIVHLVRTVIFHRVVADLRDIANAENLAALKLCICGRTRAEHQSACTWFIPKEDADAGV